jgi:hypothetical protein
VLTAIVFAGFVTVVALLSWRLKDSAYAPRSCCSNRWPPDDLTGQRGEDAASAARTDPSAL